MPHVRVISFDLWDTVFADDSDEPKRRQLGLPSKPVERRDLVHGFLSRHADIERALVDCAYDTTDAAYRQVWRQQHVTWTVEVRLRVLLGGLKRELPDEEFRELVRLHEEMELRVPPDLVPGVADALKTLARRYRLMVISDTIFSPGRVLRELLAGYGLLDFFSAFVFSDELGWSKPAPQVFRRAAELMDCQLGEMVHIGDRERNDIAGPKALGARAVLLTAAIDRGTAGTQADAVCADYRQLPDIIESMDTGRTDDRLLSSVTQPPSGER
ncbi:MAG TPA: HAD family hydrolase [Candidatus Acidoferrales bacterium]|jgi:HAD superfamily hydrolase (TIGR01549 family)|nr:HAD family hydrolase [Candidatus Acidoferrales bacterium]